MGFALRGLSKDSLVAILKPLDHSSKTMPSGYKSVPTNEKVAVARESNNPINKTVVSHYGATQGAPTGVQIADNASDAREPEPLDNAFVVNLIIVSLCTMCGDSSRGVCFPTLWLFVESLGGDHENQGFAVALFSAGRIFSSPVLGYLSSVWGYRWVLTIAMLLMAVGCLFYMAAGSLFALYCAQFSIGIGAGILGVTRAYVSERSLVKDRTVNLAYLTAAQYGAFTVLPVLGGILAEVGRTYRRPPLFGVIHFDEFSVPCLFIFFLSILNAFLMVFVFDENVRATPRQAAEEVVEKNTEMTSMEKGKSAAAGGGDQKSSSVPFDIAALGISQMAMDVGGCLLNVTTKGTIGVYETLGSALARDHLDWHTERIGYTFAFFGAVGTSSLFCFRYFYRYFNDLELMMMGICIMVVANSLLHNADTLTDTTFTIAIGIMYGCGYPIGHTALLGGFAKIAKKGPQGFMLGMFASAGSAARIAFPLTAGFLADTYSDTAIFLVMTIVLVASNVVAWIYRKEIIAIIDS